MIDWLTEDVKYAETALSRVNAQNLLWNFHINAMGPVLVSKVLLCFSAATLVSFICCSFDSVWMPSKGSRIDDYIMAYRSLHRCSQRQHRYLEQASKSAITPLRFTMRCMPATHSAHAESLWPLCL